MCGMFSNGFRGPSYCVRVEGLIALTNQRTCVKILLGGGNGGEGYGTFLSSEGLRDGATVFKNQPPNTHWQPSRGPEQ